MAGNDPDVIQVSAAVSGLYPRHVLLGYVVVAEWVNDEGKREITRHIGPTDDAPDWEVRKWLHEGLDWPEGDEDGEG